VISPERVSVNQFMVPQLGLDELCRACRDHGVSGLGVLRSTLDELGPAKIGHILADHGLTPTSVCVVLGLTAADPDERRSLFASALAVLNAAAELGVPTVIVAGGPGPGLPLRSATHQAVDAIAALDGHAHRIGARILLEPVHPMMVGQSVLTSFRQAAELAETLSATGVVLDTWHVWSEFDLDESIGRHSGVLDVVHLADWQAGTEPSLDRALPGDGIADLAALCGRIKEAAGDREPWWEIEVLSEELNRRYRPLDLLALSIQETMRCVS